MNFNPKTDIPDLSGKIILITGGTDGLGKETLRELSLHSPSHIYLTARNRSKANKVLEELAKAHAMHCPITVIDMDLGSLASVKAGVTQFLSQANRLDILICNAGLSGVPALTKDGYEVTFGTNHLGHALLIQLLLPVLQSTASSNPDSDVRVVTVSSIAEQMAPKSYTFDQMKTSLPQFSRFTRYAQSKLANIHYAKSLAQRYPEITFTSVHPGAVRTNFADGFFADQPFVELLSRFLGPLFFTVVDVGEGARGQLWCATGRKEEFMGRNGEFYHPVAKTGKGSRRSKDMKMAEELWVWTEEQLKTYL